MENDYCSLSDETCKCVGVWLFLHSFSYTDTAETHAEREIERGGASACRHLPSLWTNSLPSASLSRVLKHAQTLQSLTQPQANGCNPSICSLHQRMQRREKVTYLWHSSIRTALMQRYILPLLLILGVRSGLGTPLTSSPSPTEAPSVPPDPCEGRPCLNGGVCGRVGEMEESQSIQMQLDFWAYTCICSQGFTGQNCEVRMPTWSTGRLCMLWDLCWCE